MTPRNGPAIELRVLDRRLHDWGLPDFQTAQAAGIDLIACVEEAVSLRPQAPAILIPTGIAVHMASDAFCALVLPRSGLGHKRGLVLGNGTGVIDADYMAQIFVSAWNRNPAGEAIVVQPGERIAQLLFVPVLRPTFRVVDTFSGHSARGLGGFGSTGGVATVPVTEDTP
ncbi:MAG TPA: dUTP diphosphatase [Rhodanobacteraceae bacterium]|nr:dUTP diphosphatase [Rhodanobacteraceae bacterium]